MKFFASICRFYQGLFSLVILNFILMGCAPLITERASENAAGGVPYMLPKSLMTLQVTVAKDEAGNFKDMQMTLEPELVPDASQIFYLEPKFNPLYESNHVFTLENGLLNTVSTTDTGVAGDVLVSLVDSAINVAKASEAFGFLESEQANPLHNSEKEPTADEVLFAFGLVQDSGANFVFAPKNIEQDLGGLPGTRDLIRVRAKIGGLEDKSCPANQHGLCLAVRSDEELFGSVTTETRNKAGNGKVLRYSKREKRANKFDGVLTRVQRPERARLLVLIDENKLRQRRIDSLKEAIRSSKKKQAATIASKNAQSLEQQTSCVALNDFKDQKKLLDQQLDNLSERKLAVKSSAQLDGLVSRMDDLKVRTTELSTRIEACKTAKTGVEGYKAALANEVKACSTFGAMLAINQGLADQVYDTACSESGSFQPIKEASQSIRCSDVGSKVLCNDDFEIKRNEDIVMLVSDDVLRVPLKRAIVGKTENSLEFTDGLLTKFDASHPSAIKEIALSLNSVLQSIVALPAELIQLRLDLSNSVRDELVAKTQEQDAEQRLRASEARAEILEKLLDYSLEDADADKAGSPITKSDLTDRFDRIQKLLEALPSVVASAVEDEGTPEEATASECEDDACTEEPSPTEATDAEGDDAANEASETTEGQASVQYLECNLEHTAVCNAKRSHS